MATWNNAKPALLAIAAMALNARNRYRCMAIGPDRSQIGSKTGRPLIAVALAILLHNFKINTFLGAVFEMKLEYSARRCRITEI